MIGTSSAIRWETLSQSSLLARSCRFIALLAVAGLLEVDAVGSTADDDDNDEVVAAQPRLTISDQQFDQYLEAGGTRIVERLADGKVVVASLASFANLKSTLAAEIQIVARACSLTATQKNKLELAGRGDIDRLADEVADMRRKCVGVPVTPQQYSDMRNTLQAMANRVQLGIFREPSSLFQKTLEKTLNGQQRTSYQVLAHDRKFDVVERALDTWSRSRAAGITLSSESRKKFVNALVEHGRIPQTYSAYCTYIVLFEAARLESQVMPLLSNEEWQAIAAYSHRSEPVRQVMQRSGIWPPNDEDGSAPKKD